MATNKKSAGKVVSIKVVATNKGQNGGKIRRVGEKFTYRAILKDGELPSWVEALEKLPTKEPAKAPVKPNLNDLVK